MYVYQYFTQSCVSRCFQNLCGLLLQAGCWPLDFNLMELEEPKPEGTMRNPDSTDEKLAQIVNSATCSPSNSTQQHQQQQQQESVEGREDEEAELNKLLLPDVRDLPLTPPSAVESNFVPYFAPDFTKPGHDQYVYRHANGLCVIGLAPTHLAFKDEGGVTEVDFNVGKTDRSEIKVTGKRKKNAQHFESNTALCKVVTTVSSYIVRCCVKGSLLEVNDRIIKRPGLLNTAADREGYIAIIMPKPADWLKAKALLLGFDEYKKLREHFQSI